MRALQAVVPQKDFRYYLNGIYYDHKEQCLVATDGYGMLIVPVEVDVPMKFEFTAKVPDARINKSDTTVTLDIGEHPSMLESVVWTYFNRKGKRVSVVDGMISGKFPDYKKVVNKFEYSGDGRSSITFNPELISRVTEALGSRFRMVTMNLPESITDPVAVEFTDSCKKLSYLFMCGKP
jgi:hypothetical protein